MAQPRTVRLADEARCAERCFNPGYPRSMTCSPTHRRVHQNVEAEVRYLDARYPHQVIDACFRRWFILKQDKIFWFKSDVVTPVSLVVFDTSPVSSDTSFNV